MTEEEAAVVLNLRQRINALRGAVGRLGGSNHVTKPDGDCVYGCLMCDARHALWVDEMIAIGLADPPPVQSDAACDSAGVVNREGESPLDTLLSVCRTALQDPPRLVTEAERELVALRAAVEGLAGYTYHVRPYNDSHKTVEHENERLHETVKTLSACDVRLRVESNKLRAVVDAAWALFRQPKERWHEPLWVFRDELKAALDALDKDGGR